MNVCAIIYLQATFERLGNHSLEEFSKVMSSAINAFKIAWAFTCLITIKTDVTEKIIFLAALNSIAMQIYE